MIVLNIIYAIILILLIYILTNFIFWVFRSIKITSNIPGPPSWPIIGSTHKFVNIKSTEGMFKQAVDLVQKYTSKDKIGKIWVGSRFIVVLVNPQHILNFLSNYNVNDKDMSYDCIRLTADGVLVANGKKWQELRKPLNKLLNKSTVESYLDIINDKSTIYCSLLKKYADSGLLVDLRRDSVNCTMDIYMKTLFHHDLNEMQHNKWNVPDLLMHVADKIFWMTLHPPHCFHRTIANISGTGRTLKKYRTKIWNFINSIIDERKAEIEKSGEDINESKNIYYGDYLLKKIMDENLSRDETGKLIADSLYAGFDTSGIALCSTILMLAMHPEHQEGVYNELIDILGDNPDILPTWEDLSKMNYLKRVIKETLRHFSVQAITRYPKTDIDLGDGFTVPKSSSAGIFLHMVHRDPEYWSHPEEFYPDHFLPEEVAKRPKGSFLPFSWGPRGCPGSLFAMIKLKCALSAVIRRYKFESDLKMKDLKKKVAFMVELSNGYFVRIKSRDVE